MLTITKPCEASCDILRPLSTVLTTSKTGISPYCEPVHYYEIEYVQSSESSCVLFVRNECTEERVVIKFLHEYEDTRYHLGTVAERQQCQREALAWNRVFTPDVYLGLICICDPDLSRKRIGVGELLSDPVQAMLDPHREYGLVMRQLPMETRLNYLLNEKDIGGLEPYIQLLIKRIVQMHTTLKPLPPEEGRKWGSLEPLWRKLEHNLALADPVIMASEENDCTYSPELKASFNSVKNTLLQAFKWQPYQACFEERVQRQCIKRCHGDLKAPNIWVHLPNYLSGSEPEGHVAILDAIDFNPMYSNIDILSDFATLVVDVQIRKNSPSLADHMIEEYLNQTEQQDSISRFVLAYYLVEKAFISAAISFVYDHVPDLGWASLEVARMRLERLQEMQYAAPPVSNSSEEPPRAA